MSPRLQGARHRGRRRPPAPAPLAPLAVDGQPERPLVEAQRALAGRAGTGGRGLESTSIAGELSGPAPSADDAGVREGHHRGHPSEEEP